MTQITQNRTQSDTCKLSFCIPTFNRSEKLGVTLDAIIAQSTDDCEIVVSDNASTDNTEQVVLERALSFARLRYIKHKKNMGMDRNIDCAVSFSHGEFCWLMPDDDSLKPGAVAIVLREIMRDYSLVVINTELVSADDISKVLIPRLLNITSDRTYASQELDKLFVDTCKHLSYMGSIIIKRSIWLARDRERYYDSMYLHVGVIFQESLPGEVRVIEKPLISVQVGNQFWLSRWFEIGMVRWPELVWELAPSEHAKSKVCSREPWLNVSSLVFHRAMGSYSISEYQRWVHPRLRSIPKMFISILISLLPGALVNTIYVLFYSWRNSTNRTLILYTLRRSRFCVANCSTTICLREWAKRVSG